MRIALTFNLMDEDDESQAERFRPDYVDLLLRTLHQLGHDVVPVEASRPPDAVVKELLDANVDLVFNMAEGTEGTYREALLPTLFEFLNLPYTGGGPELLAIGLDKRLTEELLQMRGVRVPKGCLITKPDEDLPEKMEPPFMVKPNYEGSSMGIHADSVVDSREKAIERARALLKKYPEGIDVEEFIDGREITVPILAAHPDVLLEPLEYVFPGSEHNIFDFETKSASDTEKRIETRCPAELSKEERKTVMDLAARAFSALRTPDFGRADIRLRADGRAYLIEVNPIPGLRPESPVIVSAKQMGLAYEEVIDLILQSACARYDLCMPREDVPRERETPKEEAWRENR